MWHVTKTETSQCKHHLLLTDYLCSDVYNQMSGSWQPCSLWL